MWLQNVVATSLKSIQNLIASPVGSPDAFKGEKKGVFLRFYVVKSDQFSACHVRGK